MEVAKHKIKKTVKEAIIDQLQEQEQCKLHSAFMRGFSPFALINENEFPECVAARVVDKLEDDEE